MLALAGAFQFTPLKDACLDKCRHPGQFLMRYYERGAGGGFRLGARHGVFCVGCCWALMLVMFAAGVASLLWMAAAHRPDGPREDPPLGRPRRAGHRRRAAGGGVGGAGLLGGRERGRL